MQLDSSSLGSSRYPAALVISGSVKDDEAFLVVVDRESSFGFVVCFLRAGGALPCTQIVYLGGRCSPFPAPIGAYK